MVEHESCPTFFVAGGTVPPGSPSYVERAADRELFEALLAGEYAFVLNSRQMGKSSLAVRTIARLNAAGVRTAFVDLTRLGATGADPERWYAGLLMELGRALGLRAQAMAYLKAHAAETPAGRLFGFLADEALGETPLVVFVDEVDATRTLPFPADDLFAGIRQAWNARATDPRYASLAFCLMGAALPGDLIRDPRMTPFNVGRRIELRDFTAEEARPFAAIVGDAALARVLHWTGGHPYLTQALCAGLLAGEDVDTLVRERYLNERARDTDGNLADVGNRLLGNGDPDVTDPMRADALAAYDRMLKGGAVADDEANPAAARIKMSGVARVEGGLLRVRNRIYAQAFGHRWVREAMPGQEYRRQRRAFWKGALRTGVVAAAVIALVARLAFVATQNGARAARAEGVARTERDAARYDAYVASMQTMLQKRNEGNGNAIRRTLETLNDDPARGWEYAFWNHAVNDGVVRLDYRGTRVPFPGTAPGCPYVALGDADAVFLYDVATGRRTVRVVLPHAESGAWLPCLFHNGRRVLACDQSSKRAALIEVPSGKILQERRVDWRRLVSYQFFDWDDADDRYAIVRQPRSKDVFLRLDLTTLETSPLRFRGASDIERAVFDACGAHIALIYPGRASRVVSVRRATDFGEVCQIPIQGSINHVTFSPDSKTLAIVDGKTLTVHDARTGRTLGSIPYLNDLSGFQFSPDGRRLLVSSQTRTAEEFDVASGTPRLIHTILDAYLCEYVAGGRVFVNGDDVRLIEPSKRSLPSEVRLPGGPFQESAETDERLWVAGGNRVFAIDKADPLRPATPDASGFTDDRGRFVFRENGGGSALVDLRHPGVPRPLQAAGSPSNLFFSDPAGDHVGKLLQSGGLGLFRVRDGALPLRLQDSRDVRVALFSPDGRWVAAGDTSAVVTVWDAQTGRRVAAARLGRDEVSGLAFSEDSRRVAAISWFGDLGVLDVASGATTRLLGAAQDLSAVAWSHDGSRVVAGGSDRKVRLWDARTGRELGEIGAHDAPIVALWFTPGDRTLCSLDSLGTLKLWPTADRL